MIDRVIKVVKHPLPRQLTESALYMALSTDAQRALLEHIRYVQEIPEKIDEWLSNGSLPDELEPLVERLDLDLMINLGPPSSMSEGFSPWIVQVSWVTHNRPLTSYLRGIFISGLNQEIPIIGAGMPAIRAWIESAQATLQGLLDDFFQCSTYDHAVAHLVAIHTSLAGLKLGLSRIRLQYPRLDVD